MKIWKVSRLLPAILFLAIPSLQAGSLNFSTVGLFPKDASEFGYADLSQARQHSWFAQFEAQVVPVTLYGFEQFLDVAQMNPTPSIEQVAWARVTAEPRKSENSPGSYGQLVGVATGHFDPDAIQSFLDSRKAPGLKIGNNLLYSAGTGSGAADVFFTIIDSETIAFGPLGALKRMLSVHRGDEENLLENEEMMGLIDQANGDGMFWGVLDSAGARSAIQQLVPEAEKFPQARDVIGKMKHILISVRAPSDIELDLQADSGSPNDALLLSQLLQAGVLYRRYQASQNNSGLAEILDGVRISASGNQLELSFNLTNDQVLSLIEHNTFSVLM